MSRPSTRSKHGTANHGEVANDQVNKQRSNFSGSEDGIMGASRTSFESIFNLDIDAGGRGSGEYINSIALGIMSNSEDDTLLMNSDVPVGESYDFPEGYALNKFKFSSGNNKFMNVESPSDTPFIWGPNLNAPSKLFKNSNAAVGENVDPQGSYVKADTAQIKPLGQDNFDTNGYGVSNVNNDPRKNYNNVNILQQRNNPEGATKLGEYINTETYDYNE